MRNLADAFPDPAVLLGVEPEELAGQILRLLRRRHDTQAHYHPARLGQELESEVANNPAYAGRYPEVSLALSEALAWIEVQGLAVPDDGISGTNGWLRLSRRARKIESPTDFAQYVMGQKLPRELLHSKLSRSVWLAFMRGEYDVAVFQAMKTVEVAVRDACGDAPETVSQLGVKLMREAFDPTKGPLTDSDAEKGEREARSALFAGAIGSFKNPYSHREVLLSDASEAAEIIMLAGHLLRIVDARKAALS